MKIKTFPLKFIDTDLETIGNYAKACNMTKEQYIMTAIEVKNEVTKTKYRL